jgi:hypothetical protein
MIYWIICNPRPLSADNTEWDINHGGVLSHIYSEIDI